MPQLGTVFLDTNILKFSSAKQHVYRKKLSMLSWGDTDRQIEYFEPYTVNVLQKIKNKIQGRDASFLGVLAYAGQTGLMKFYTHREVEFESWGLPRMNSVNGRFFGCPIDFVADPMGSYSRTLSSMVKSFDQHTLEFLTQIKHPRYIELLQMAGAYQGKKRPLNLNQALDAFYIWCAECAGMDYFLTMDYKLCKVARSSKIKMKVKIVSPDELLRLAIPKLGLFGMLNFLWRSFRFAKPLVGFEEGKGWN